MRMTGVHRNMGANPRLFVFGYCLVVTVQFGVTSVTAGSARKVAHFGSWPSMER